MSFLPPFSDGKKCLEFPLFVPFYLGVFSQLNFASVNICHLTFVIHHCDCLCDTFQRPFGNLSIDMLVSASTLQNFIFPLQKLFAKIFLTNITLVLNYLTSVSLWYDYSFLYDLFFIHPEASIGILEESLFEFSEHPSISIPIFGRLPSKTSILESYSSTFAGLLGVWKTTHLERFMSILDVKKKACLRNFRQVQRCAHAIICLIWRSVN